MVDKTPVIDLKGYLPGWDSVNSARMDFMAPIYLKLSDKQLRDALTLGAVNFHGKECGGVMIGIRVALSTGQSFLKEEERWRRKRRVKSLPI